MTFSRCVLPAAYTLPQDHQDVTEERAQLKQATKALKRGLVTLVGYSSGNEFVHADHGPKSGDSFPPNQSTIQQEKVS